MSNVKNILITGASGFIGRHLLEDIDLNAYHIRLITRKQKQKLQALYPQFEVVEADLNNLNELKDACHGIEIIVNTAAEVRNTSHLALTNIEGTKNLIEAIVHHNIKKVIHLSSVGVVGMQYSTKEIIVSEEIKCHPKNEYERTKLISEELLLEAQQKNQFSLDIIRPTNVFGENHPFNALLGLMKYIKSGKPFIYGKHAQVNYLYVKDLTLLICDLLKSEKSHGLLNIGHSVYLEDFYKHIQTVLKSSNKSWVLPEFLIFTLNLLRIKRFESVTNKTNYSDSKLMDFYQYHYGEIAGLNKTIAYYKQLNLLK